jgi:hypothetical protein
MGDRQVTSGITPSSWAVEAMHAAHARFDIWPAKSEEMGEARELAARLIGVEIVKPETLSRVHERTGGAVFVARQHGRVIGVWAAVLLSGAGFRAALADTFNAIEPETSHIADRREEPVAIYIWGIVGATRDSAHRIVAAGVAVDVALAHLPAFTRPTTPAGRRIALGRMGFKPLAGSDTGLVWMEPRAAGARVAA